MLTYVQSVGLVQGVLQKQIQPVFYSLLEDKVFSSSNSGERKGGGDEVNSAKTVFIILFILFIYFFPVSWL